LRPNVKGKVHRDQIVSQNYKGFEKKFFRFVILREPHDRRSLTRCGAQNERDKKPLKSPNELNGNVGGGSKYGWNIFCSIIEQR
jgi:hypothetical protein